MWCVAKYANVDAQLISSVPLRPPRSSLQEQKLLAHNNTYRDNNIYSDTKHRQMTMTYCNKNKYFNVELGCYNRNCSKLCTLCNTLYNLSTSHD